MNESVHYQKAMTKIKQNQFAEAIELLTKAIEEQPNNPFNYMERAVCYLNLDKYSLSLFDMNKSIELDDAYAYFYSARGFLKARMKDFEGGLADYEKSLELDPKNEITYNNMGLLLEQMGSMKRAQKMFEKGNELMGYDPTARTSSENLLDETPQEIVKPDKIQPPQEQGKQKRKLAKEVFSKKSTFKEFLGFIGNGFKLKSNDKK